MSAKFTYKWEAERSEVPWKGCPRTLQVVAHPVLNSSSAYECNCQSWAAELE